MRKREALVFFMLLGLVGLSTPANSESLPDGDIAKATGSGPVQAWYTNPTKRYGHGVLGDKIEAGSLVAMDEKGLRYELDLPQSRVFEDITPRLADLDADGINEIITIRTDLNAGASVAIYGIRANKLSEIASTKPIGLRNRWLSIAGIGNFLGNGRLEIAIVKTPHINGTLEVLSLQDGKLNPLYKPVAGYATHVIGSRHLSLAAVGDLNGDGVDELVLPSQDRKHVAVLNLKSGVSLLVVRTLPSRITQPIVIQDRRIIRVKLDNGETQAFSLN